MRKVTATTAAANVVIKETGYGWLKFNDKLKDGTRSLKVLGWTLREYQMAAHILHRAGYDTKIVNHNGYSVRGGRNYTQIRLHVKEV